MHAVIYGPKTNAGWPATGLSLRVNAAITYNFDNKASDNRPYSWEFGTQNEVNIWLPYDNAAAQTTGFTIPQDIVDNGLVLAYLRYYRLGYVSDTATGNDLGPWHQMPYSFFNQTGGQYVQVNMTTQVDYTGFNINLLSNAGIIGFANDSIPATIRIVLLPAGQVTDIERSAQPPQSMTLQELTTALETESNQPKSLPKEVMIYGK